MLTNCFPITLKNPVFSICRTTYSPEELAKLRAAHNLTHSFFRCGDFIYASPMETSDKPLGSCVELKAAENLDVVSSLIKHIFFRTFHRAFPDVLPLSFYPFRILSRKDADDLVREHLREDLKGVLCFRKQVEVQFRLVRIGAVPTYVAVIALRYRWIFGQTCLNLAQEGFDLHDAEVLESQSLPGLNGILAPEETFVGTVRTYDSVEAKVETAEGVQAIPLANLTLHKSQHNLGRYLKWKIGSRNADALFRLVREDDPIRLNGRYYFEEIQKVAQRFAGLHYSNKDGFSFSISQDSNLPDASFNLQEPTFNFDYTPGKSHAVADMGLNEFGPYDRATFEIKSPRFLTVCHKRNRGAFSAFLDKFKNGIPSSRYFKKGFRQKFDLHDIVLSVREVEDYTPASYISAIKTHIKDQGSVDLVIIETRDEFRDETVDQNPYYLLKAYLLSSGIPVQFVNASKIRDNDSNLQYLCNTMSLQVYAKLGGTPWVLPANRSVDREIIVGIGSSTQRTSRFAGANQERIIAITTFFSGDGQYLLSNKCSEVDYEHYFDELLKSLRSSIREISSAYGWQPNDTVRIVFHIFKTIKDIEGDVVSELVATLPEYDIKFAFVTVSSLHPFAIFDPRNTKSPGTYIPNRGTNLILDDDSCLIQLRGAKQHVTKRQGLSNPVLIRIHPRSTFRDLQFITQQIYHFTSISLRSFLPSQTPVTIYYSDLIARFLFRLRGLPGWNTLAINTTLKRKKWFL